MREKFRNTGIVLLLLIFISTGRFFAQEKESAFPDSLGKEWLNWYNQDPLKNLVLGAGVDRLYAEMLQNINPAQKVIVAVIDGGVDVEHVELSGKIWKNPGEIPGNRIDDDQNGYVDDIHGWNFLGNEQGENIHYENLEQVRLMKKYNSSFQNVQSADAVPAEMRKEYKLYLECRKKYLEDLEKYQSIKRNVEFFELRYTNAESTILTYLGKDTFSLEDLRAIKPETESVKQAKDFLSMLYVKGFTPDMIEETKKIYRAYLDYHLNMDFEPRKIISDNVEDINDRNYGNNQVNGPGNAHGTFVAGIIAGNRDDDSGIDGVSTPVEIMVLRTVPDGDERDKDIALSIRYAVDNGAKVINMSFGKDFSPQKYMIDDAIRYAEEKGVLLVHAAGNDGMNIDINPNYPNDSYENGINATNMITVGASSKGRGMELAGVFSNYGRKNVDVFAPGVQIISLAPGNRYKRGDGTSYAAPVVSGVAALLLAYYPNLSPQQVKEIILKSATNLKKEKVQIPNTESDRKKKTNFGRLSATGGIVNAYNAFLLAREY